MPGYIMHLCEGQYILNNIDMRGGENDFLLGCVMPDAVSDKNKTHFRPAWQSSHITKYPDIGHILELYPITRMTFADLGILAHLIMDARYVTDFWPRFFQFENEAGMAVTREADISCVRLTGESMQPAGTGISLHEFFSNDFFYGDYDRTGHRFQHDFHTVPPAVYRPELTISECSDISLSRLEADLKRFVCGHYLPDMPVTRVFPYDSLRDFVIQTAEDFISLLKRSHIT